MDRQLRKYSRNSFIIDWHAPGQKDIQAASGLTRSEAATIFSDASSLTISDPQHPDDLSRFITIGTTYTGRLFVIAHTDEVESGAPENNPDMLLIRIDDAREPTDNESAQSLQPLKEVTHVQDEYDFSGGTRGRYVELVTPLKYIDDEERYWFNVPAHGLQTCLWWVDLEHVESHPDPKVVDLRFDIERIRKHHHLPEDLRFVVRLEDVSTVRAYRTIRFPSGTCREETMSWREFETTVNSEGMWVEDTLLARDEGAPTGVFVHMPGLMVIPDEGSGTTADVTFRIHAAAMRVLRTDGVPCSLEELEEMGNAEWDASQERHLARKHPLIDRIKARFRRATD